MSNTFKCDLIAALHAASRIETECEGEVQDWEIQHDGSESWLVMFLANEDADNINIELDANDGLEVEIKPCGCMSYATVTDSGGEERFIYLSITKPLTETDLAVARCMGQAPLTQPKADKSQYNSVDGIASEEPVIWRNLTVVR